MMKALVLTAPGKLEIIDRKIPELSEGQALVKVKAVGLNRRDQWIKEGQYPGIKQGVVLGSDASGVVEKVASEDDKDWEGAEVVINPNINWGIIPAVQSKGYEILGMPTDGTFAEYIAVNVDRLCRKPAHLAFHEAAALPLGGLTAYRAVFRFGKIEKESNVLISGFGGGVAQFAFQFAKAVGANVFVTSGNDEKIQKAVQYGAKGGFNYKNENWHKDTWKAKGGFDVVIDSAGGDQVNTFIKIMRPTGRIVFYGATNGRPSNIDLHRMFWNQITLQGSSMGNDQEFGEMVDFVNNHKITPIIDSVRSFDGFVASFDEMVSESRVGKLVANLD